MNTTIKKASSEKDLNTIREIAHKTWPSTFSSILSPDQINYMLEWMYSLESLKNQINDKGNVFLIASFDGEPLGFASYEMNYKSQNTMKLHKIYILPEAQGKGIGASLIKEIKKAASEKHQTGILLNVNRQNPAVKVYEHLGFKIIGEENIDIGNGFFMNDFVMELTLAKT